MLSLWVSGLWGDGKGARVKGAWVVRVEDWVVLLGTLLNSAYLLCLLAMWLFFGCIFFILFILFVLVPCLHSPWTSC